jgi:ketosteroid isomerase-like protein
MRLALAALGLAALCLALPVRAGDAAEDDRARAVESLRSMYAALTTDDAAAFHAVTASGFYAFEGGKRFTGDALLDLIKAAHAAGKVFVWTVTEPEVAVDGNVAWITYVNKGSLQDASGPKDLQWLESAVLRREAHGWRIVFFHSTRVPSG